MVLRREITANSLPIIDELLVQKCTKAALLGVSVLQHFSFLQSDYLEFVK